LAVGTVSLKVLAISRKSLADSRSRLSSDLRASSYARTISDNRLPLFPTLCLCLIFVFAQEASTVTGQHPPKSQVNHEGGK